MKAPEADASAAANRHAPAVVTQEPTGLAIPTASSALAEEGLVPGQAIDRARLRELRANALLGTGAAETAPAKSNTALVPAETPRTAPIVIDLT